MTTPNPNYLQAELLWRQLNLAGVTNVVISPGSRSTPLARTAALFKPFTCHVLTDERVAAFFALGLAKGSAAPVALLCTSGTAPAHYFPAVIEAAQSAYPLIVITADRPPDLRNQGAPQTIDQPGMFGKYVKMTVDLNLPVADAHSMQMMLHWTSHALDAMLTAPLGPVHINVPMDEPLAPIEREAEACRKVFSTLAPALQWTMEHTDVSVNCDAETFSKLEASWCGLLVCGPDSARDDGERNAILGLARKLGWPILCDVASGLRFDGEPNMAGYELFLRHEEYARLAPDVVLEFGSYPTSKTLNSYLARHKPCVIRFQRDALRRDPDRRASQAFIGNVASFCSHTVSKTQVSRDSLLLDPFWKAANRVRAHLAECCVERDAELSYVHAALKALPDQSNLVLASSMPIRYADLLGAPGGKRIHVFAQRGTNGIDGVIAHAAGIARSTQRPTLLICGDLAFLHDLGGWSAARSIPHLRVLLLNNNGGGIFHFLPISEYQDTFEQLHGTPVHVHLRGVADLFDIEWHDCLAPADVDALLVWPSGERPVVIEVKTDRVANRSAHEHIIQTLLRKLDP